MDGGVRLPEIFFCPGVPSGEAAAGVISRAAAAGAEVFEVTPPILARLSFGERSEGVVAVGSPARRRLEDLPLSARPLVAVLEGIEKPGNVGAIVRSADAAGLDAIVVANPRTDLYNPNAIRASLGTLFSVPVCEATTGATLDWLRSRGLAIFAARVDGSVPYTQADFRRPAAIVLGSEAEGLSTAWTGKEIEAVRLPMRGAADSLNVSAAAAVLFFEAVRHREEVG